MGSLEKFSEAVAVLGQKKESLENVMGLMMSEWAGVEDNSKVFLDLSTRIVDELESKQKHSTEVVESVQAGYALLNSKKRWLEEGMKKLDENVEFVRGVLKEVKEEQVQFRVMRDSMDQQLKELGLKEKRIQHISEVLNLTLRDVEERKNELGLMEKALNGIKDGIDSRQKELEARELEVCVKEEMLDKRQHEIDSEHIKARSQKSSLRQDLFVELRICCLICFFLFLVVCRENSMRVFDSPALNETEDIFFSGRLGVSRIQ